MRRGARAALLGCLLLCAPAFAAAIRDPIRSPIEKGTITVELETVAEGLISPLGAAFPNDGSGRIFIYEQTGAVRIVAGGKLASEPLLDVQSRMVRLSAGYDERGLIGLALHPDFKNNRKLYTHTSEPARAKADFTCAMEGPFDHQQVIAEWTVSAGDPNKVDPASRRELLRIDHPQMNHDGGAIAFGRDGYLYFGMGDGGAANDRGSGHAPGGNGQDTNVALGKLLRIDVNGKGSANGKYGIPKDNPFVNGGGLKEIYAWGLREPYFISFDMADGKTLYIGDVGQNEIEEVDVATAPGANFGWPKKEGTFRFDQASGDVITGGVEGKFVDPVAQYDHDEGVSVIGGFVYRGKGVKELGGRYVFGDLGRVSTRLGRLFYLDEKNQIKELKIGVDDRSPGMFIKGFAQDREGEVYVCGSNEMGPSGRGGKVMKIVRAK